MSNSRSATPTKCARDVCSWWVPALSFLASAFCPNLTFQRYPQAPESPYQWPTDEPYFRDHFQRASITLTGINNLAAVLRDQGKYGQAGEMYRQTLGLSDWAWADYWDQRVRISSECRGRWVDGL